MYLGTAQRYQRQSSQAEGGNRSPVEDKGKEGEWNATHQHIGVIAGEEVEGGPKGGEHALQTTWPL